ncbi:acyl-CoA dehydrogenase family protein [Tsukamurella sp. NPDC003166]|uniref:acyl-CoA dehydrogenase family protein n=1 Tax=Tsukamurella sp. NPDC003166 TaxID=3154444 RepID=UPI0033B2583A
MTTTESRTLPTPDLSPAALGAVTAEIAATAERYDRSGEIPWDGLAAAHRAGLLTATVAAEYGGPGLGPLEVARILVAIGEGDASVALLVANTLGGHQAQAVARHWPEAAYADLLARSVEGPALVNTIRAEPELGAPARGGLPATTATRVGDAWVVNGRKAFATGGEALAYHLVWAVTDDGRVGHLVVPGDAPGITWIKTWDHLGLRASNTHDVVYDGVEVPAANFVEIPRVDGRYVDPAATPSVWGLGHAALYIGVARAARAAFADFATTRVPTALGRPIATTERIQTVAGEIDTHITIAETLLAGGISRVVDGDDAGHLAAVKVAIARSVVEAVQTAVGALGNAALTRRRPLERHLRDVLCVRVHPPQEDVVLLTAGRRVLGI